MIDFESRVLSLLEDIKKNQIDTLNFFKSIEESSLGEIDSQKYLDELGKDKFHPPMG